MRGHAQLVAMRKAGRHPVGVWIDADCNRPLPTPDDWHEIHASRAHLQAEPGDKARRLDLRCVIGMPCYVDGTKQAEVFAMRDACIEARAARVIATVMEQYGHGEFVAFRLVAMTDTEGVHDWCESDEQEFANG